MSILLGHNGAGKSTTVNVLTGLYAATAGQATVFGHDLLNDIDAVRAQIGYCAQSDDSLFDQLTVEEHLRLFGAIQGLEGAQLEERVNSLIADLGLGGACDARDGNINCRIT